MLKITPSLDLTSKTFEVNSNKIVESDSNKANKMVKNLSKSKKLKNPKFEILTYTNISITKEPMLLILSVRENLNYLRQMFVKVLIL